MALGHDGEMCNLDLSRVTSRIVGVAKLKSLAGGHTGRSGWGWPPCQLSFSSAPMDDGPEMDPWTGTPTHAHITSRHLSRVDRLAGWFPQFRSAADRIPRRAMCVAHLVTCLGLAVGCESPARQDRPLSPPVVRSPCPPSLFLLWSQHPPPGQTGPATLERGGRRPAGHGYCR